MQKKVFSKLDPLWLYIFDDINSTIIIYKNKVKVTYYSLIQKEENSKNL